MLVVLLSGNHTLIGLYDLPLLVHELYLRGYRVRGLAHPGHWKTPLGPLFQNLGAVKASPMAAYRLLQDAQAVLLFPGGGREVSLHSWYTALWCLVWSSMWLAAQTVERIFEAAKD